MDLITDLYKLLRSTDNLMAVGSTLAAILAYIAYRISFLKPKNGVVLSDAINGAKVDQVDGLHDSYERQFDSMNERVNVLSAKVELMSETIHKQQIKLTRLQVLVIQLKGLLVNGGATIPPFMADEIKQLVEDAS